MKDSPTRQCGACNKMVKVTVDGRLYKHRESGFDGPWCPNTSPYLQKAEK